MERDNLLIQKAEIQAQEMARKAKEKGSRASFSTHVDDSGVYVKKEKSDGLEIVLYPVTERGDE